MSSGSTIVLSEPDGDQVVSAQTEFTVAEPLEGLLRNTVRLWIGNGGVVFFWAALILIFAVGRGHLSRVLCHPWMVQLGEISFAIYMCHMFVMRAYVNLGGRQLELSGWIQYPLYWIVVIAMSWALWRYVELPARHQPASRRD